MKTTIYIALLLILTNTLANAQHSGNSSYSYNYNNSLVDAESTRDDLRDDRMTIDANVMMNSPADAFVVVISITQRADSLSQCNNIIQRRINAFTDELKKLDISAYDVHVDFVSQVPVYEYEKTKVRFSKTYNELPKGFEQTRNIHIKVKREDLVQDIVNTAARYEMYDIVKVDYIVTESHHVYDSLRNKAIDIINEKVATLKKLGVNFDMASYKIASENFYTIYPVSRYQSYSAYSSNNVWTSSGTYNSSDKKTTVYYDAAPNNDYDFVFNPIVLRPAVQFTYNLRLQYQYKRP